MSLPSVVSGTHHVNPLHIVGREVVVRSRGSASTVFNVFSQDGAVSRDLVTDGYQSNSGIITLSTGVVEGGSRRL